MEPRLRRLVIYEAADSSRLFETWLDSLKDLKGRAIIRNRLDRLALGLLGEHHDVGDGTWELVIDYGPGYRVYYGEWKDRVVVLLAGGTKRGQSPAGHPSGQEVFRRFQEAKQMIRGARAYDDYLRESLKDPVEASAYLQVALEDRNPTVFLMALRNVALAHGGLRDLSKKTKLNRETLYRILSEKGNPALVTLHSILQALGLQIMIAPKKRKIKRAA